MRTSLLQKKLRRRSSVLVLAVLLPFLLLLTGCGPRQAEIDMEKAWAEMEKSGLLPPVMRLDADEALNLMGLEAQAFSQFVVYVAEDSLLADEVILLAARDKKSADSAFALLEERHRAKAEEARSYSPEQYAIIQQGIVKQEGQHLLLLVSPQADSLYAVYNRQK